MPWENNHYRHDGNPSLDAFSCNISNGGGGGGDGTAVFPSCDLIDVVTENVKGACVGGGGTLETRGSHRVMFRPARREAFERAI